METEKNKHNRKLNRLKDFDYSSDGSYFITICVKNRAEFLSEIIWNGEENHCVGDGVLDVPLPAQACVRLTDWGEIADKHIKAMGQFYKKISVDNYVIMPNHIHMLLTVKNTETDIVGNSEGTSGTPSPTNALIPKFVSTFKRFCNKEFGMNIFQRSYNDHIIRNQEDYITIYNYIEQNPYEWKMNEFYFEQGIIR